MRMLANIGRRAVVGAANAARHLHRRQFHSVRALSSSNLFSNVAASTPLTQPLPHLPSVNANDTQAAFSDEAKISTLPSGLRVVTLDSNSVVGSVGVFIDAGSRYDDPDLSGLSHFMELVSFKSTKNRSDFRLVRDMLKVGGNITASASREHFVLTGDAMKPNLPQVMGALADVIQHPAFLQHEIIDVRQHYEEDVVLKMNAPDVRMMEGIHEAAYFNNTLGTPLYAPIEHLSLFDSAALHNYTARFFTPSRIVVAGVGVAHEDLRQLTDYLFNALPADQRVEKPKSQYTGGECRTHHRGMTSTHLAIAFETASWNNADLVPMCVLQMLMGGGGSFSAGGPGKGMYSRLYTNVLNKHDFVESASSFNSIYSDSSLFGIYGISETKSAGKLADVIIRELLRMSGPVDAIELKRAKNALKSAMLIQLESRGTRLEDIGKQLLTLKKVWSAQEVINKIDAVTAEDVQRVAKNMLATNPSVAAHGDLTFVPRYDFIQKAFK